MRVVLEDYGHYATGRKPREGEDALLVLDEFSALASGVDSADQPGRAGPRRRRPGRGRRPDRRRPRRPPPSPPAAGLLCRRDRGPPVPRPRAAAGPGRDGPHPGAQLGAGPLRPPRVRQGPHGRPPADRPRAGPPGPARRSLGDPGRPVHPSARPAPAGRHAGTGRADGHASVGRRHRAAADGRGAGAGRDRGSRCPGRASRAASRTVSRTAAGADGAAALPRRGGRGWSGGPCPVGGGDEAAGGDRPRLRRRAREPCARTRTGRLPAGRAATWPPPASRALRVPAGWPAAPLDPAVVQAARRDPVARGGRGAAPDQQAGGEDRGGPAPGPPPPPAPADPLDQEGGASHRPDHHRDQPPSSTTSPRRAQLWPTPTSPSPAT